MLGSVIATSECMHTAWRVYFSFSRSWLSAVQRMRVLVSPQSSQHLMLSNFKFANLMVEKSYVRKYYFLLTLREDEYVFTIIGFLIFFLLLNDHFSSFAHFFYWVVFFWLIWKNSLYCLLIFDCYIYCKYFFPISWFSFKIVYVVFCHIEVSHLPGVKCISFFSYCFCFLNLI